MMPRPGRAGRAATVTVIALAALLTSGRAATAGTTAWTVSPSGSRVGFAVEGRFYPVTGRFHDIAGEARIDPQAPARSGLTLTIGLGSVDTGVPARDGVLRGARVFDAARHARAVFRLTGLTPAVDGIREATGSLTWRGVTRPVQLVVREEEFDPAGGRLRISGETVVSRSAYGLSWTPRINPIGDTVRIVFALLLTRP